MKDSPGHGVGSRRGFLIGAAAAAALAPLVPVRAAAGRPLLFGYRESRRDNLKPFVKWTGTLDRYFAERKLEDAPCSATRFNKCHLREWKKFLASVREKPQMFQLNSVNRFMNSVPYITDPINYGVRDYWATPVQFFRKNGDCEDYAIAKYLSLRALGYPSEDMRIVVVRDNNLGIAHAVLAVYQGPDIQILDNQIRMVITHDRIRHYRPVYSINEHAWWVHKN